MAGYWPPALVTADYNPKAASAAGMTARPTAHRADLLLMPQARKPPLGDLIARLACALTRTAARYLGKPSFIRYRRI